MLLSSPSLLNAWSETHLSRAQLDLEYPGSEMQGIHVEQSSVGCCPPPRPVHRDIRGDEGLEMVKKGGRGQLAVEKERSHSNETRRAVPSLAGV